MSEGSGASGEESAAAIPSSSLVRVGRGDLRAKLARLRREVLTLAPAAPGGVAPDVRSRDAAPAVPEPPAPRAHLPLPGWLTTRFGAEPRALLSEEGLTGRAPGTLGAPVELEEHANPRGTFSARRRRFALDHEHGAWHLSEVLTSIPDEFAWLTRDATLARLDPARCVYLDIETTGLSGGAGTVPFLVALGTFAGDEFVLWQAFLRDPGEEAAALTEVAERIAASTAVVSFFGKSFDRHRLEDKMRLHRITPPFAGKPHLDLYHPLRRLYRGAFEDGRLATFERELCDVAREGDLPGSLAPAAWFDFLAGRPHRLEAVFQHNELDVLSLVTLAAHLACTRRESRSDGRALGGPGRARARALAELHAKLREYGPALTWLDHAVTRSGSDEGELWFRRAECLRKLGQRDAALAEFLRLARERKDALGARAWAEVARLARSLKQREHEQEALLHGLSAAEHTLTGRARARALAAFARKSAPVVT